MKFAITTVSRLTLLLLICVATGGACAAAADFKDFRDWYAACDNLRNCSAYGFETTNLASAYMRVERGGAPSAPVSVTIVAQATERTTVTLAFDDPALGGLPSGPVALKGFSWLDLGRVVIDNPAAVETLIASMRKAQTLVVRRIDPPGAPKSGPETSEISMSGAVAALLWIDEQQQRLGTRTALIRRGDRPALSIPPQPKAPVVQAAKPLPANAAAAKTLSPSEASALTAKAKALCGDDDETKLEESARLDRGTSLYNFICPSGSGAYNLQSVFMVVPDTNPQAARPVNFAYPIKIGSTEAGGNDANTATNGGFDPATMTLSTFSKGRGIADCGTAEEWVWDGRSFRLTLLRIMPECKGIPSEDWPVLYRAERK